MEDGPLAQFFFVPVSSIGQTQRTIVALPQSASADMHIVVRPETDFARPREVRRIVAEFKPAAARDDD